LFGSFSFLLLIYYFANNFGVAVGECNGGKDVERSRNAFLHHFDNRLASTGSAQVAQRSLKAPLIKEKALRKIPGLFSTKLLILML